MIPHSHSVKPIARGRPTGPEVPVFESDVDRLRRQLKQLAWLMDESIPIPILGIRVGLDGLLGLIPGVGDLISAGISTVVIRHGARLGVPKIVLLRMAFNTAIDFLLGSIPLVGDIFDFAWKANKRNVALVLQYLDNPAQAKASSWLTVAGFVGVIGLAIAALAVAIVSVAAIFA